MTRETWLAAAPESAVVARALVREEADRHGLDKPAAWDLMLATTEAVANAIEHGAPCDQGIRLAIEPLPQGVRVEVRDCGCGHLPPRADAGPGEPHFAPASAESTRGRGLPIIAAVTDRLELSSQGPPTWIRFEKLNGARATEGSCRA